MLLVGSVVIYLATDSCTVWHLSLAHATPTPQHLTCRCPSRPTPFPDKQQAAGRQANSIWQQHFRLPLNDATLCSSILPLPGYFAWQLHISGCSRLSCPHFLLGLLLHAITFSVYLRLHLRNEGCSASTFPSFSGWVECARFVNREYILISS